MVPVLRDYPYYSQVGEWPVLGPKHTDADFFSFEPEHYHVDYRFVTSRQARFMRSMCPIGYRDWVTKDNGIVTVSGAPLSDRGTPIPKGRPVLARRRCRIASYRSVLGVVAIERHERFQAAYGSPAEPIRLSDGRLLCPHRKVDLPSFEADGGGIVVCPLHGLHVKCGVSA